MVPGRIMSRPLLAAFPTAPSSTPPVLFGCTNWTQQPPAPRVGSGRSTSKPASRRRASSARTSSLARQRWWMPGPRFSRNFADRRVLARAARAARCASRRSGSSPPARPRPARPRCSSTVEPQGLVELARLLDRAHRDPDVVDAARSWRPLPAEPSRLPRAIVRAAARRRTAGRPRGRGRCARSKPRSTSRSRPSTRSAAATIRSLRMVSTRSRRWARRRRSSSPVADRCSRWRSTSASTGRSPRRGAATVLRIGGSQSPCSPRESIISRSRAVRSTPSRSALLMTKTSAISRMPALIAWMSSPRPGTVTTTTVSTVRTTSTSSCPTPDGLDQDPVEAGGVEQVDRVARGAGEAAHGAAGGHRADEDARIGVERLHADAVAEEGAAGVGAGRIDGEDAHRLAALAAEAGEAVDQGALAGARRAGDADHARPAGVADRCGGQLALAVAAVLHAARSPAPRPAAAAPASRGTRSSRSARRAVESHCPLKSCRAITRRWISLVPSPIVQILASRKYFSAR